MKIIDGLPEIIRLPLRGLIGVTIFAAVVAGFLAFGYILAVVLTWVAYLLTPATWGWIGTALAAFTGLCYIGAKMES